MTERDGFGLRCEEKKKKEERKKQHRYETVSYTCFCSSVQLECFKFPSQSVNNDGPCRGISETCARIVCTAHKVISQPFQRPRYRSNNNAQTEFQSSSFPPWKREEAEVSKSFRTFSRFESIGRYMYCLAALISACCADKKRNFFFPNSLWNWTFLLNNSQ